MANHGQVNPKRFIFSLHRHDFQNTISQIEIGNIGKGGTNFTHKYSFIGGMGATPLPVVKGNDEPVKYKISLYDSLTDPHFTMLPQDRIAVLISQNDIIIV